MKMAVAKWLKKFKVSIKTEPDGNDNLSLPYTALSPIANASIDDYKKALDWALKNRTKNDIKNIALTGPYGSGKTSILKTYIANYKDNDLHFLHLSLATFKEEKESDAGKPQKEDILRQIELSILQQIFYHEDDSTIPDSRFRKIKNYTKRKLRLSTIVLSVFFFSLLNLIYPELLEQLLKVKFPTGLHYVLRYFSFLMVMIGFVIIIYKSIRIFSGIKLSKLNIQNAEIEIGKEVNKSILNHHIDEILYFFEVTEYNVVIIEDLDRFKQTDIFTKLREINLLINNSKKINREIVFIYAVRDDMFKDQNERTKFFDFIIPVIPVINPSNSSQKLLEKKELIEFGISENIIDSISLFIDDMRLLHNVTNEFYLYHQKLNKGLNQDRLLAIIVYKNMFPKDFTLLSNNEGVLYDTINSKQIYRNAELDRLEDKLKIIRDEIKELENLKIKDIKELRLMYLPFFMSNLHGFISFYLNGIDMLPEQMVSDKNFDYLINSKAQYRYHLNYSQSIGQIPAVISGIEGKVDADYTYQEKKKKIDDWNANKLESLKKEIQQVELDKFQIRNLKIRELLVKSHVEIIIADPKQKKLVSVLLRDGYINEDYLDYISLFYEGSITSADHQFFINVKSQIYTEFNHKLHKVSKLISKISELEFDREYVLNYNLMDEVLNDASLKNIRDRLFVKLKDESEVSTKFIDGFLDSGNNITSFIMHLVKRWSNIWTFLETKSNFTQERKEIYFKLIIAYAEVVDIKKLYEDNYFKSYLLGKKDFLSTVPNPKKLQSIIKTLDIKFTELDINEVASKELINFVYAENFYSLNIGMIKLILSVMGKFNETDFNTKNYSAILSSGLKKLEEYLHQNINQYVQNVYLKLEDNNQEDQGKLIDILNNKDLEVENKLSIIKQVETKVDDLSLIDDLEIAELLLEESKCLPIWENIYHYYERNEKEVSESIVIFLEKLDNGLELSKTKINTDISGERKYTDFIVKLITNNKFSEIAYDNILKSVPYNFPSLDLISVSKNKVSLLLKHSILTFNTKNYESLKQVFPGLHIQFIEIKKSKFLMAISDYEIDSNDLLLILKSTNFTLSEKNQIVEKVSEDLIALNANSIKTVGELVLAGNSFRITDSMLKLILQNGSLSVEQRVRVHNWKYTQIALEDYNPFLNALGEPYSEIAILGKRPLLKNNEYNLKLVDVLNSRNYISKYDIEDKGIRISTFRKANE